MKHHGNEDIMPLTKNPGSGARPSPKWAYSAPECGLEAVDLSGSCGLGLGLGLTQQRRGLVGPESRE